MTTTLSQINLLPSSYRQRRATRRLVAPIVIVLLLACGIIAIVWVGVKAEAKILTDRVTALQNAPLIPSSSSSNEPVVAAINVPDASNRIVQLNSMSKGEINWTTAMDKAAKLIPQNIHLSAYTYSTATGTTTLRLSGTAPSNVGFAIFMQSLRDDATLTSNHVDSYTYNPVNGTVLFTVSVQFPATLITYPAPSPTP